MKISCNSVLLLSLLFMLTAPVVAGKRVALVIGNSRYQSLNYLPNPGNDAQAIADKLKALNFDLVAANGRLGHSPVIDLAENNFLMAIKNFSNQAQGAEIAIVYYAGYGMQFGKGSYSLPVDVPKSDIDLIQRHAISLEDILKTLDGPANHRCF